MVDMGYKRESVEHSLRTRAYDDSFATYLLLGTKASDVSLHRFSSKNLTFFVFELHKCLEQFLLV